MPAKPRLTHFLALPLYNASSAASLTASISKFIHETSCSPSDNPALHVPNATFSQQKESRSRNGPVANNGDLDLGSEAHRSTVHLPPGAIRPPSTLHLTLGVMSLSTPERVEAAADLLRGLDMRSLLLEKAVAAGAEASTPAGQVSTNPFQVELKGLDSMQETTATSVLYAPPLESTGRLMPFCKALRAKFADGGLLALEARELKLHATIVNTIYVKEQNNERRRGRQRKLNIDAHDLIDQWKDYVWASVTLDKVVIYEMGAMEDLDGLVRYHEIAEAPLP